MKEFKDYEDLIKHLKSKGVTIESKKKTINMIEKYTYYSIINGYKSVFLREDGNYIKGTDFNEIYALYEFDKNIKYIFLEYLLEIELLIKSSLSYIISKNYGVKDYLSISNLDLRTSQELRTRFIKKIEHEIKVYATKNEAIQHFVFRYNSVPPYVLIKILSYVTLSKYYGLLKQSDRQYISKQFKLSDQQLKQVLINYTRVRNICAHQDRLYDYRSKSDISLKGLNIEWSKKSNVCTLYIIFRSMELFLEKEQYKELKERFYKELETLEKQLHTINITEILNIIGFDVVIK